MPEYPSPGGNAEKIRGYLVQPAGQGPWPAVLVIHENRGLNPYIEDVARRAAVAGFLALAPDGLSPLGGYPGNDDDGRALQAKLDQGRLRADMLNGARFLKGHKLSSGKLGVTGFCWGGGTTNWIATAMGADLNAGVPFYGAAAETASVPKMVPIRLAPSSCSEVISAPGPPAKTSAVYSPRLKPAAAAQRSRRHRCPHWRSAVRRAAAHTAAAAPQARR